MLRVQNKCCDTPYLHQNDTYISVRYILLHTTRKMADTTTLFAAVNECFRDLVCVAITSHLFARKVSRTPSSPDNPERVLFCCKLFS